MNTTQITAALRYVLTFIGGILVARGIVKAETIQAILSNEAVIGMLTSGVMFAWGLIARTNKNLVVAAESVPSVEKVKMDQSTEGKAIAAATGPKVTT